MDFILRPWRREDAAAVAQYANNEKIARNLRDVFPYPYTLADAESFVDSCLGADGSCQLFRAIEVEGRAAGSIALCRGGDVYTLAAELGYWLAEDYWGQEIMTRAVQQICEEGFTQWNDLVRIYAAAYAHNTASRRVLEKAGFILEGVLRQSVFKRNEVCDSCMYALLREEWQHTGSASRTNLK